MIKLSDIFVSQPVSHLRPQFRSLHCFHLLRHIAGASFNFITWLNANICREVYFPHSMCMKYNERPAAWVAVTYFWLEFSYNSWLLNKHTLTPHNNSEHYPTMSLLFSYPNLILLLLAFAAKQIPMTYRPLILMWAPQSFTLNFRKLSGFFHLK